MYIYVCMYIYGHIASMHTTCVHEYMYIGRHAWGYMYACMYKVHILHVCMDGCIYVHVYMLYEYLH